MNFKAVVALTLICTIAFIFYVGAQVNQLSNYVEKFRNLEVYAQFGDGFGVVTATFTVLITLITLLIAFYAKKAAEFSEASTQLIRENAVLQERKAEEARKSAELTAALSRKQSFESLILSTVQYKDELIRHLKVGSSQHESYRALSSVLKQLIGSKNFKQDYSTSIEQNSSTFRSLYDSYPSFGQIANNLKSIFKNIYLSHDLDDKTAFAKRIRDNLTQQELQILFFLCVMKTKPGLESLDNRTLVYLHDDELIEIANKFNLFENMKTPNEFDAITKYAISKMLMHDAFGNNPYIWQTLDD